MRGAAAPDAAVLTRRYNTNAPPQLQLRSSLSSSSTSPPSSIQVLAHSGVDADAESLSIRGLLRRLRRAPRAVQLHLELVESVRLNFLPRGALHLADIVASLPPVRLASRSAGAVMSAGVQAGHALSSVAGRIQDATLGRVQRSLPVRCVAAYARMIAADIRVVHQLHCDAAQDQAHSSAFISSTSSSCSLAPLSPSASTLTSIGWRARRFVYALARASGQARKLLWGRSVRHWPLDALTLWFQLILLALPGPDARYDNVRESLLDCLRWYEVRDDQHRHSQLGRSGGTGRRASSQKGGERLMTAAMLDDISLDQIEGIPSPDPEDADRDTTEEDAAAIDAEHASFLASLSNADSGASPARILHHHHHSSSLMHSLDMTYHGAIVSSSNSSSGGQTVAASPIELATSTPSTAVSTPTILSPSTPSRSFGVPSSAAAQHQHPTPHTQSSARVGGHGRFRSHAGGSLFSSAHLHHHHHSNSRHVTPRNLSMGSLDNTNLSSHAQGVYNRALDLLAREGIDLHNVSMNDTIDDGIHDDDGNVSDSTTSSHIEWDALSEQGGAEAREIQFFGTESHTEEESEADEIPVKEERRRHVGFERERGAAAAASVTGIAPFVPATASEGGELSLSELERTTEEPGKQLTPEGAQRRSARRSAPAASTIAADAAIAAAAAASTVAAAAAIAAPLPRLLLPLHLHVSSMHLSLARTFLEDLQPHLAQICFSHDITIEILNQDLREWNDELKAAKATFSSSTSASAAPTAADSTATASSSVDALRAPTMHLVLHDSTSLRGGSSSIDSLLKLLNAESQAQNEVGSSTFLLLLHPSSSLSSIAASSPSAALATLRPFAHRHPLLQSICSSGHVAFLHTVQQQQLVGSEEDNERMEIIAEAMLQTTQQGLQAQAQAAHSHAQH